MEKVSKALDEVINCIINSKEYKECISLKKQMADNEEIMNLIDKVKKTQKEYIKSGYDKDIKNKLDSYNEELLSIPLYHTYNQSLEKVNEMINTVKEYLNDYFYKLLNK